MKKEKLTKLLTVICVLFIVSLMSALIIEYPNYNSSYDLDFATGVIFRKYLTIIGLFGLAFLVIKKFKGQIVLK